MTDKPVFTAFLRDVRPLTAILRGVALGSRATITLAADGMVISVEELRTSLARAYIPRGFYEEYNYVHPDEEDPGEADISTDDPHNVPSTSTFEISLKTLIECLNIFGSGGGSGAPSTSSSSNSKRWRNNDEGNDAPEAGPSGGRGTGPAWGKSGDSKVTFMRMSYAGEGTPLCLLLAEDKEGPSTTVEIVTSESEGHLDLPLDLDEAVVHIIMKSSWLRDALSEMESSVERLTFICVPPNSSMPSTHVPKDQKMLSTAKPCFRIKGEGTFGIAYMDYPNDREVLEVFECEEPVHFSYSFKPFARIIRALQVSAKASIRIVPSGLMGIQFELPKVRGINPFIEFRCLAKEETSD